jgi:hypothetical protein
MEMPMVPLSCANAPVVRVAAAMVVWEREAMAAQIPVVAAVELLTVREVPAE